jgi:hypothetical protein
MAGILDELRDSEDDSYQDGESASLDDVVDVLGQIEGHLKKIGCAAQLLILSFVLTVIMAVLGVFLGLFGL